MTNNDLIEAGVDEPRIASAWLKAKVKLETARRRKICRICGKPIHKGEECVVSEDQGLVSLYEAFWSLKVAAHKRCYEKLTLPRGLEETSPYRKRRFCPICGKWFEIFNGEESEDAWPQKSDNAIRCPYCHSLLRLKPRRLQTAPRVSADLGDLRILPARGQLTLDDFTGRLVIVKRGEKVELYKIE